MLTGAMLVQKQLQAIELDYQADEDIEHALKAQSSSMHLDIEAADKRAAALQVFTTLSVLHLLDCVEPKQYHMTAQEHGYLSGSLAWDWPASA